MENKSTFKMKDIKAQLYMTPDKVMAITRRNNIEVTGYKELNYNDFADIMILERMKDKQTYASEYLQQAQHLIKGLGENIKHCTFSIPEDRKNPLVIMLQSGTPDEDDVVVLISPRLYV